MDQDQNFYFESLLKKKILFEIWIHQSKISNGSWNFTKKIVYSRNKIQKIFSEKMDPDFFKSIKFYLKIDKKEKRTLSAPAYVREFSNSSIGGSRQGIEPN